MAMFFRKENHMVIYPDVALMFVVVNKSHIFVAHQVTILNEPYKHLNHLWVLIYIRAERISSEECVFDVSVPEVTELPFYWRMFSLKNSCPGLPDDIFHEFTHIYRVFPARTEVFDEPFFGLKMNGFFELAYPFSSQTNLYRDGSPGSKSSKGGSPTPGGYFNNLCKGSVLTLIMLWGPC